MSIKGIGRLMFIGVVIITLIILIDESDAAKKVQSSSQKEKEQAELSEAESAEKVSAEENMKSSKLYKKKKSQEKFSKKSKKNPKLNEGEIVQNEPVKVKKLRKAKLSAEEVVYEEEQVGKPFGEKPLSVKYSKKVNVNKIKSEDLSLIKSKKQKKTKYVEEEALPLEKETQKIKKAKKIKATKVAEEGEINENIPAAAETSNPKRVYVYVKLSLEELQHFKEYQQQKQRQQIIDQEKVLESVVFEDVRPKKKQYPRGVNIPAPKKTEDQEVNKTIEGQVQEVAIEVRTHKPSEPSSHDAAEQNSTAAEQISQDADKVESNEPAPVEEELLASKENQEADNDGSTI